MTESQVIAVLVVLLVSACAVVLTFLKEMVANVKRIPPKEWFEKVEKNLDEIPQKDWFDRVGKAVEAMPLINMEVGILRKDLDRLYERVRTLEGGQRA